MDITPTTQRCSHCKETKPFADFNRNKSHATGYDNNCRICARIIYLANREKKLAYRADYTKRPEVKLTRREYMREWERKNPERKALLNARYRLKHQERLRATSPDRYQKYKHKAFIHGMAKRARLVGAKVNDFTYENWLELLEEFTSKCAYCGTPASDKKPLERDHIIPLDRGGDNTKSNIVPACEYCNSAKGDKTGEEFVEFQTKMAHELANFRPRTLFGRRMVKEDLPLTL